MIFFSLLELKSLECMSNSEVKHFVFQFKELCKDNIQTHSIRALFNLDMNEYWITVANKTRLEKCQHFKLIRTRRVIWKKSFNKSFLLKQFVWGHRAVCFTWLEFLMPGISMTYGEESEHQKATHSLLHIAKGQRDTAGTTLYFTVHV